jgi:FKBP-type peptidyl-prolyl cis-trans isomerase 2
LRACSGVLLALLLGSSVACSGSVAHVRTAGEVITGLTVDGTVGKVPNVRMKTPLSVDETTSVVTAEGTGPPVQVDQLFVVELSIIDARTGKVAVSQQPIAAKTSDDQLFPKLDDALVGVRQGSRVVLVATPADAFASGGVPPEGVERADPVVVVADLLAVPPATVLKAIDGRHRAAPSAPKVAFTDGMATGIDFTGVTRPSATTGSLLVVGSGPVVRSPGLITVHYVAQRSGEADPFEDTFFKEPEQVALGTGTAPPAWDKFLVGVHRGSRLVIYGPDKDGMIAWVVDVLGVS